MTEPEYFESLRRRYRLATLAVEVVGAGLDPSALVAEAERRRELEARRSRQDGDRKGGYDEVWCVVDVDEHARLAEAQESARRGGLILVVSNPCFELWALLHFQDQTAHITRDHVAARLRKHMPGYVKRLPFDLLEPHYGAAVERANNLQARIERGLCSGNPSTSVHAVTERIRSLGELASEARTRGMFRR